MFQTRVKTEENQQKQKPDLSGDVQRVTVQEDGTKQYENVGSIALWDNAGKIGKQPDLRGNIQPPQGQDGETYYVSVWRRATG